MAEYLRNALLDFNPVRICVCEYLCFLFCLADLFDILLPMLNIYQEFVRNHQYSLQVLANCKQNRDFDKLLKQYESNAACEGRMLETFLTYPMFQVNSRAPAHTCAHNCQFLFLFVYLSSSHLSFTNCSHMLIFFFFHFALLSYKIPRYIITLHELLAHTPHEHVERKSLEFAKSKLEELSRYVSDCQNNYLAIICPDILN